MYFFKEEMMRKNPIFRRLGESCCAVKKGISRVSSNDLVYVRK